MRIASIIASLLFPTVSASAELCKLLDAACHSRHFAESAGLQFIREGDPTELRIWGEAVLLKHSLTGYVITESKISTYTNRESSTPVLAVAREVHEFPKNLRPYIVAIVEIQGTWVGCTSVKDGYTYLLEGSLDGKHFSKWVANPDGCDEPASANMRALLKALNGVI